MRSSFPPLSCLLAFDATARRSSFTLAAAELSLTPSAVSHQVAKLERMLSVRLLDRSARTVGLTPQGREYMARISGALNAIGVATDNARSGNRQVLHVHASPSFASLWLMPRLADFAQAYPDIALTMSSSVQHSDFSVGQADLDVRYGLPGWPHLHVEAIFDERIQPLASPAFLDRHRIRAPRDLIGLPLIQSSVNVRQWGDWFRSRGIDHSPSGFAYRFDRTYMALDAAVQGLGVAFDSASIAAPHLASGQLVRVFRPQWCLRSQAHFLVCPPHHLERPQVSKFVAWVQRHAKSSERAPRERVPRREGSARRVPGPAAGDRS